MRFPLALVGAFAAIAFGALLGWLQGPGGREALEAGPPAVAGAGSGGTPAAAAADAAVEALTVALAAGEFADWERLVVAADRVVADVSDRSALARALIAVHDRDDAGTGLRAAVLVALEHLGGVEGVRGLADIARRDGESSSLATTRLSRVDGHAGGDALVEVIEACGRRGPVAASAVRALGKTRLRRQASFVSGLTTSAHEPRIRREAAEALGKIAATESIDALGPLLAEADWRLRCAAVAAIGRIRSPTSRRLLEAHLEWLLDESRRREPGLAREIDLTKAGLRSLAGQPAASRPR